MSIRLARSMAVMGACALWAACAKGGEKADSAAMADSAARAAAGAPAAATPTPPTLTDTSILGLLDEINAGDSAGGKMASTKGTDASVKKFGRDMMRDHHTLRKAGQDLAKKLNITPAPPAGDTLSGALQRAADTLTAMPKGAAWDKWYIDHEVTLHQFVVNFLQSAPMAAMDTSVKAAISKSVPLIQAHLMNAQSIQSKLPAATAAGAAAATADSAKDTTKKKSP